MTEQHAPDQIGSAALPIPSAGLSRRRRLAGLAVLVLGLPVLTDVLVANRSHLSYATPVLLVLTLVVVVALIGGLPVALPAAVLGGLDLNWFFTPPYGTLAIQQPQQLLVLVVYGGFAVAVSVIVDLAARRASEGARARAEALALSRLAGATLAEARTLPDLLEQVRVTFGLREVSLLELTEAGPVTAERVGAERAEPDEQAIEVPAGAGAVLRTRGPVLFAEDRRVLISFAQAAGTALEGRRLAERAQDSARLEAAERMRTALLAAVGHDLRTPLAGIKAAVSSLRQTDVDFTDDERGELLESIEAGADRLQSLVANLLDASRLQAGALSVHLQPAWLDETAGAVLLALPPEQRVRVLLDLAEELPPAQADPGLLERVLANLLDNALRHAPAGTTVTLRTARFGADVGCEVIDHGPGVPGRQWERVFAPFQRLDDHASGGIGLGLSVARGFTEAMRGTLEPSATPGGGLTMRVVLPAAARVPAVPAATVQQ